MDVIKLKQLRKAKFDEAFAIIDLAERENRDLTEEEIKKRDALIADMNKLDGEIQAAEELEKRKLQMAADFINKNNEIKEQKELSKFNLIKAIRQLSSGRLDGLELEVCQEGEKLQKAAGLETVDGRMYIPANMPLFVQQKEKRDVVAGSNIMIGTYPRGFYDALIAKSVFGPGGYNANIIKGLVGNVPFPAITSSATAYVAGSENAQLTESQPTIAGPTLTPRRIGGYVEVSQQLAAQQTADVNNYIANHIIRIVLAKMEQQVIAGTGSSGEMTGIINTSGIGSVIGGADGAAPTWNHILSLESAVAAQNADVGQLGYLTNPLVRGKLKATEKSASGTVGNFVWENSDAPLNGYRALVTTNVPSNLTKGTSVNVCSAIIFGNFSDLVIGQWGNALELIIDPYSKADSALIRIIVNSYWDAGIIHAQSFAAMLDALTA